MTVAKFFFALAAVAALASALWPTVGQVALVGIGLFFLALGKTVE